jgi:hypothetical protein
LTDNLLAALQASIKRHATRFFTISKAGGEQGLTITRATFAVMIKLAGLKKLFGELLTDFDDDMSDKPKGEKETEEQYA